MILIGYDRTVNFQLLYLVKKAQGWLVPTYEYKTGVVSLVGAYQLGIYSYDKSSHPFGSQIVPNPVEK